MHTYAAAKAIDAYRDSCERVAVRVVKLLISAWPRTALVDVHPRLSEGVAYEPPQREITQMQTRDATLPLRATHCTGGTEGDQ